MTLVKPVRELHGTTWSEQFSNTEFTPDNGSTPGKHASKGQYFSLVQEIYIVRLKVIPDLLTRCRSVPFRAVSIDTRDENLPFAISHCPGEGIPQIRNPYAHTVRDPWDLTLDTPEHRAERCEFKLARKQDSTRTPSYEPCRLARDPIADALILRLVEIGRGA